MSSRHAPRHRASTLRRTPRVAVGAVAAAVGVVLLMGGQGSFASWTSSRTLSGGQIAAGTLALTPNPGCTAWTFTQTGGLPAWVGSAYPAGTTDATGTKYVEPSDTLTATCTYTLVATGEHVRADLTVTQPTISGAGVSTAGVTATAAYTVNGAVAASVTDVQNGATVVGTITLTIPSTLAATSPGGLEGTAFTVGNAAITLAQVHS